MTDQELCIRCKDISEQDKKAFNAMDVTDGNTELAKVGYLDNSMGTQFFCYSLRVSQGNYSQVTIYINIYIVLILINTYNTVH